MTHSSRPRFRRTSIFNSGSRGTPCSAVSSRPREQVLLLGVTRQLIGEAWCEMSGFRYCGSIGPVALNSQQQDTFDRIGQCLCECFALTGLFGVDAVINDDGVWPIEVNPRYTASCELFDRSCDISTVAWHVDACELARIPTESHSPRRCCGKAIVYAKHRRVVSKAAAREMLAPRTDWPELADIPLAGTTIEAHGPVVTVFAEGVNEQHVLEGLQSRVRRVQRWLEQASTLTPS